MLKFPQHSRTTLAPPATPLAYLPFFTVCHAQSTTAALPPSYSFQRPQPYLLIELGIYEYDL